MIDSTLKNANILIVDDQQENIDVLVSLLENKGYTNIKTTTDPRLAVSLFEEFKPDLLLLDLIMQHLTGFQVMEQLKPLIPTNSYFPILILTADVTHEAKQLSLSNGATDFLVKPFDLVEVDLRIKNMLKERYLHLQLEKQNQILDEASEFGENLINTVREPLLALDQDLRVVKANRSFYDFFKVSSKETIGTLIYDLGNHQWNIPKLRELLETILPEKATFDNYEVEHVFSTIGKRIMLLNARQIKRAFGKEKMILLAIEDITERKRVEASLSDANRMSNEYLDILFNHAHAPIIIWNTSFVITLINHAFEKLCGYEFSELKDKKIDVLFPKDKVESTFEIINNTLQSDERPDIIEIDILTKNKDVKTVLWNPANIFDKEGNQIVATIAQDITQRKLTEIKLFNSEEQFRSLYENSTIGFYRTTHEGKILMANKALVKLLGYPSFEKLAERNLEKDGFEPSYQRKEFINKIENEGEVKDFESEWTTKDGSVVNISESARAIRDSNGKTLYYDGTVEDITERKRAEELLRESEERFRHSFDYAATGICIVGVDQKFQRVNKAFREMIGYEEDELKNFTFSDITHPDDLSIGVSQKKAMLDGEINNMSFEKRYIRKDKRIIWAYVSASLIRDGNHKPQFFITQIIDITERMESVEELRKLSRAVEQSPVSITISNYDGKVEYVNPKFTEVTGYSLDEIKGKNMGILNSGYHQKEFYEKLWDTILSGKDWKGEFYNKKKNGELYWENGIISPIVNENGDITHFIGIQEDITEKKKMIEELITAKDIAEKSNSLKDAFIANISHEIRTPLNGILGMTGLIKEIYSPNMTGEEAEYFTAIDRSCDRIIRTTDLILNYSQLETETFTFIPKQMELSSICMNLVGKYNVSAKSKSLSLLFENKVGRTVIFADEYSITQVLSNLIENAIIYTKRGFVTVNLYQNPQNEILLDVIDSGIGIGGEYLNHIFESFRQEQMGYSRSYEGLGLGLALVKKILDLHNATISVESKKGEGTTFTINFGKSLQSVEELTAKQNIVTKVEVTSTKIDRIVLIVEDDVINQSVIKKFINKKYNTLVADSYHSVMENLENNKVDLILMDISLQGSKNGLEITKEL